MANREYKNIKRFADGLSEDITQAMESGGGGTVEVDVLPKVGDELKIYKVKSKIPNDELFNSLYDGFAGNSNTVDRWYSFISKKFDTLKTLSENHDDETIKYSIEKHHPLTFDSKYNYNAYYDEDLKCVKLYLYDEIGYSIPFCNVCMPIVVEFYGGICDVFPVKIFSNEDEMNEYTPSDIIEEIYGKDYKDDDFWFGAYIKNGDNYNCYQYDDENKCWKASNYQYTSETITNSFKDLIDNHYGNDDATLWIPESYIDVYSYFYYDSSCGNWIKIKNEEIK